MRGLGLSSGVIVVETSHLLPLGQLLVTIRTSLC